jgi:hypothetical protein
MPVLGGSPDGYLGVLNGFIGPPGEFGIPLLLNMAERLGSEFLNFCVASSKI